MQIEYMNQNQNEKSAQKKLIELKSVDNVQSQIKSIEVYSKDKDSCTQTTCEKRSLIKEAKVKTKIEVTLWDLLRNTRAGLIRRCLSPFSLARVKEYMPFGKNEAAFIELTLRNETKLKIIKKIWAVHFKEGKVVRITQGKFDTDTLTERGIYKTIIKGVLKVAIESALLRQIIRFKAKAVYISANSNGNQRGLATIYFEIAEDLMNALNETAY